MILDLPQVDLSDEEWIYFLEKCLKGWTEIPLTETQRYDIDKLRFYDGILGVLLKQTEKYEEMEPALLNREFVDSWKYQGKIYRVIHPVRIKSSTGENKCYCRLPKVKYHNMITHWTSDYTFSALYKLFRDKKYIILEADTGKHYGFDVNGFRKKYQCESTYTQKEDEIIFPMYKDCIKEYHMTINEFIEMKEKEMTNKGH